MAKQPRKPANPKPITAHPLFPAVVALWFGALFGLGSLAVRPSLLESLVIKSRIDLVLPAAAPPLGVTARILVALILAAIGSIIGIVIARKLSRPKVEVRERKRRSLTSTDGDVPLRRRDTHPDAPARRPISASDELAEEPGSFGGGVLAARRRSLAIEHEERAFVPHESAPLPGGTPQVFDVSSVGMTAPHDDAPLDLGTYAESDPAQTDEFTASPLPQAMARQVFHGGAATNSMADQQPVPIDVAQAAEAGQQIFGINPQPPLPDSERQIFGQPIQGDHVSQDFVKAAGFQTTVFETPETTPLFGPRQTAPQVAAAEPGPPAPSPAAPAFAPVATPSDAPPAIAIPATLPQHAGAEPAPPASVEAEPAIAPASRADLGMDDLASRLAESMARRRAARERKAEAAEQPVALPAATPAPEQAVPDPAAASFAPVESAPQPVVPAVPPVDPAGLVMPAVLAANPPASLNDLPPPVFAAPAEAEPQPLPQAASDPIPAALRPLDLDGFEDDDDAFLSTLPPRHIAMPPVLQAEPQPAATPGDSAQPLRERDAESVEPDADADIESQQDNYASLLGMSAPRAAMVRIEEPEAEQAEIEPVVIFPGQMNRQGGRPDDSGPFRRFDAPGSAEQGQAVSAGAMMPEVDRDEADRALRMALANLQRMSGAA